MSNLSGNYKISAGEVHGVDVVREQERRARLQLLDEIREPSPQPIFGEPVKVELEDETSRRIKNTLGDFTQVLINDSKTLLGITRQSSSTSGYGVPQGGRVQVATKRPPVANGMYKPSPPNIPKHPAPPDKRLVYPRNKPHEPPIICPPNSFHTNINNNNPASDSRLKDPTQWQNSHPQRKPVAPPPQNGNPQNVPSNPNYRFNNPSYCPNNSSTVPSNKTYPFQVNGMVSNPVSQALRYAESSSSTLPPKRHIFRPSIKLPERVWKPEKPAESPIELETILREMKQAVPPLLTAIQTPRTEECGFAFPEPKEDVFLSSKVKEIKQIKTSEPVPPPPDPSKLKDINSRQSTPSPCISSSLHDDLLMSDSDDEVQEIKVIPAELPKSPAKTPGAIPNNTSTPVNGTAEAPKDAAESSSSSESGDSDSDDSSSESNDSDSSASSEDEASDADTPSKMWGLSNFFDESRRIHSPAFVPMDTCTNSSTTAAKEEPAIVPTNPKKGSVVSGDAGNSVTREPVAGPVTNFIELDTPVVNIKNELLSPITSPLQPLRPPAQPPAPAIRGPRTPPSPSYSVKDDSAEKKSTVSSGNIQPEKSTTAEMTVPQIQIIKPSNFQQNSCDNKEDTGKVQMVAAKKPRLSKNKCETVSPRTESSSVIQSVEDDPSASKELCDASLEKDIATNVKTSSCSVPSETSESSHENYSIKTRQKVLKSSNTKKTKSVSEESLSESGQKGNKTAKSAAAPKFKHPARTCRTSTEIKQLSKVVKNSAKLDAPEEVKIPLNKSDLKEKSSSENTKISPKTFVTTKGLSKTSIKIKKKPQKISPKQTPEVKKNEIKRKKNKFHIENFLQSPTISQSETGQLSKVSPVLSPSLDKSPVPDFKSSTGTKKKPSVSPSNASQSPTKSSTKSTAKVKNVEKLRRSARCSERASSIAQSESSEAPHQDSDVTKKSIKRTPKRKELPCSPVHLEAPPSLLSPIPHNSPIPMTSSECAIPTKIMVCIPLDKISRLPIPSFTFDSDNKSVSKSKLPSVEESKKSVSVEKSKNVASKRSVSKDIKDKPRTDVKAKGDKIKSATNAVKDKVSKTVSGSSLLLKAKIASNVNIKTSIKIIDGAETKPSKKRKSEGEDKQLMKKKPKINPEQNQERVQLPTIRTDSPSNPTDISSKSKGLERCDSISSLSSLGSQMSQRSSKEKKSSITMADTKRGKSSLPIRHIKQEKEEKLKTSIKKEPGTPDKNKDKSRDKLISKDIDQKPLLEQLWSDTSSQFCSWEDVCKEDSKGPLPISTNSIMRNCPFEWHYGPEMSKDLKESSNKHNNPIMPMDYYYIEGRKQKHLAEREKDPFLQTLKYFEATVLFILTSQQREEYTKELDSVYQFYRETLNFSNVILQNIRIQQSSPGSTEFKILILVLRCQALLNVKLYSLKIKEIKEQQKNVSDFFMMHCPHTVKSLSHPTPQNPRMCLASIPSPHSPTPSPASSVNSQTSGYSSSDVSGNHMRSSFSLLPQSVNVTQSMLENLCRQHTHLINLHMSHDLWEQADMYMTRSNLREFFKEVADLSENLTLHSSIKELVSYIQTGISLVKKCSR